MTDDGTGRSHHKFAGYQRADDGTVDAACACGHRETGRNFPTAKGRLVDHVIQMMGRPIRTGPKWRSSGMGQPAHVDIEATDTPIHKMGRS